MSSDWRARRATSPGMRWIAVDLNDAGDCARQTRRMTEVTHFFYAARYDHPEGVPESVEINAAMLENVVKAVEAAVRGSSMCMRCTAANTTALSWARSKCR